MNLRSLPATSLRTSSWTPYAAPLYSEFRGLGQAVPPTPPAPAPAPAPAAPPKAPFIDSAFLALLFDGAIVVASGIAGTVFWRQAKEKTAPAEKAGNKRTAYFFYGLGGLAAVKAILDGGRIMR